QLAQEVLNFNVHPVIWICCIAICSNVHSTVRKLVNPAGTPPQHAPICTGTVQIFAVDLGCTLDSFTVIEFLKFKSKLLQKLSLNRPQLSERLSSRSFSRANVTTGSTSNAMSSTTSGESSSALNDVSAPIAALDGTPL